MIGFAIAMGVILIVIGVIALVYGMDSDNVILSSIGGVVLLIGIFSPFATIATYESKTDRHVNITYEDACAELGGVLTVLDNKETCIVKE